MTEFTNKPKRKNTPNRRRKFLLMVVLPIFALIAGFMALSPQIDAWLATDPFTPQCHFETDRWFAVGYPASLSSLNTGQYGDFQARTDYTYLPSRWSPDGQYHVHAKDTDVRTMTISRYDGTEMLTISDPQLSYDGWYWSPNSQMILYSTNTQAISVLQVYEVTGDKFSSRNFSDFMFSDFPAHWMAYTDIGDVGMLPNQGWSKNGSYILFVHDGDTYVIDVEGDKLTRLSVNIPYSPWPIWWSDTAFYFVEDQILKSYDVTTNEITDVTNLPNETTANIMVFGENMVGIIDNSFSTKYYAISQNQWIPMGTQLQFVQWLEGIQAIIYIQDADDGTIDYYQLNTRTGESTLLLNAPTYLNKLKFSSSGQHLVYKEESDNSWIIQPITTIEESLTNTKSLTFENTTLMDWFTHEGQDWLLVQEHKPNLTEKVYMTYVFDPKTIAPCKVGLSDINLRLQAEME